MDVADTQSVVEVVKLPVGSRDRQALLAFVQQWYETTFPQVLGFKRVILNTSQVGTLIIEARWTSREAIEAAVRDLRLSPYFSGLQAWLAGWPEISIVGEPHCQ